MDARLSESSDGTGARRSLAYSDRTPRWTWPDDYEPLDGARMFVRRDFVPIFHRCGWSTFDAVMSSERGTSMRRLADRRSCRLIFSHPSGPIVGYLKRHVAVKAAEADGAPSDEKRGLAPGLAEAQAVGWCQRAHVPTMNVIAAGAGKTNDPSGARSFFLSEGISDGTPADDFWKRRFDPAARAEDGADRKALLHALATTARRFHEAGLFHRDFYWCHFFVREPTPGAFAVHLIDLQRALRSPWLSVRWRLKDLAQFHFSAPKRLVTKTELTEWYTSYFGASRPPRLRRPTYFLVGLRSALYRFKEQGR